MSRRGAPQRLAPRSCRLAVGVFVNSAMVGWGRSRTNHRARPDEALGHALARGGLANACVPRARTHCPKWVWKYRVTINQCAMHDNGRAGSRTTRSRAERFCNPKSAPCLTSEATELGRPYSGAHPRTGWHCGPHQTKRPISNDFDFLWWLLFGLVEAWRRRVDRSLRSATGVCRAGDPPSPRRPGVRGPFTCPGTFGILISPLCRKTPNTQLILPEHPTGLHVGRSAAHHCTALACDPVGL